MKTFHGGNQVNVHRLTVTAILSALIIVLQVLASFIKFGPFSITLALVPILVGAALYGPKIGAFLGFVFASVVFVAGVTGIDGGATLLLFNMKPLYCVSLIYIKGIVSAWIAGIVYRLIAEKNDLLASVCSGIVCPAVNTGLFILLMFFWFSDVLQTWYGTTSVFKIILAITGVNFLIELTINLVVASAITRIIKIVSR